MSNEHKNIFANKEGSLYQELAESTYKERLSILDKDIALVMELYLDTKNTDEKFKRNLLRMVRYYLRLKKLCYNIQMKNDNHVIYKGVKLYEQRT